MNYLTLKYFMVVANELSFTNASEKLHISQQNLSQHIKRLEEYYQVELFERKPTLRLTYAGQLLFKYAQQVDSAEERFMAELSFIRKNEKGKIVLGVTTSRSPVFVPTLLVKFKQKYPKIELSLKESYTSRLEELLLKGEIDVLVGIKGSNEQFNSNFKMIDLLHDKKINHLVSDELLQRYYPDIYLDKESYKKGIELKNLIQLPVILNSNTSRIHHEIEQYYLEHKTKPNILIESNNMISMLPLCEQGQVAIFTSKLVLGYMLNQHPHLEQRLNIFPLTDCFLKSITVLMLHKDKAITKQLSYLIEITKETFVSFQ